MAAQQLTVADVLSHRVGLRHNAFDRDLEANVDYCTLTQKLAYAPMACAPGTCYGYQNIAFSLIGDVIQAAAGDSYGQAVQTPHLPSAGYERCQRRPRGHRRQPELGAPACAHPRWLAAPVPEGDLLPRRPRRRRQRQRQRHGAVAAGPDRPSPRRAVRAAAGHPPSAAGHHAHRVARFVLASRTPEFRQLRFGLARVRLRRPQP